VAKHFSGPNAKKSIEELKKNRGETQSLEQFTKEYMLENLLEIKRLEVEKKRERALEARDINAKTMVNVLNELGNTKSIPLEAFANSYKIIAMMQGLEGKKAENYVKNRIVKSIKKTNDSFYAKKCESCFATAKVADIKKLFAKLK